MFSVLCHSKNMKNENKTSKIKHYFKSKHKHNMTDEEAKEVEKNITEFINWLLHQETDK